MSAVVGVLIVDEVWRFTEWFTEENQSRIYEIMTKSAVWKILLLNALTWIIVEGIFGNYVSALVKSTTVQLK